ncbi:MAG: STAS domain-containing protein [Candidatus Cloacimonetes bacterium]|nr:STAS domain-containing protein [Candidatus Cloacimonadota bacterium]MBS3768106.1 STAS domain-containing protein [Candidatus Cloacimonadota bacterium]
MDINEKYENDVMILELKGRLDANTSEQLEKKLIPPIDNDKYLKIIIDFADLEYISSAGLRLLLLAAKKLDKKDGKIVLCAMQDFIKEVFEISGFTPIFPITEDQKKALAKF